MKRLIIYLPWMIFSFLSCSPSEDEEEASRLRRMVHLEESDNQQDEIVKN